VIADLVSGRQPDIDVEGLNVARYSRGGVAAATGGSRTAAA